MKNYLTYVLLLVLFSIGSFLRIYGLSQSPPTLNWDEAAWGYNAYSVMQTGKDEYGESWPLFTRSFDEYKPMLPSYFMMPFIRLFGLTETAVRLPSAILGSLSILLIYFFSKKLLVKESFAIAAAGLLAIEPWAVHLSRVYHDANIALFFLLASLTLFLYSEKKPGLLIIAAFLIGFSWFTYNANKLLIPLIIVFLGCVDGSKLYKNHKIYTKMALLILGLWGLIFIYFVFNGQMFPRAGSTHIFRLWQKGDIVFAIFHMVWEIVGRYFAYFSPPNLFVREPLEPSTILTANSIFHPFEFIFWILGLYLFLTRIRNKYILGLIALSPIPAVLTWNWFQPGRVLTLFAMFSIVISVGVVSFIERLSFKNKFIKSGLFIGLIVFMLTRAIYVFDSLLVQLPHKDAPNWQPGFDLTVPRVMELESGYKNVVINSRQAQPYIFYLFYGKYDPSRYHNELDLEAIGTPRKSFDFGKFKFRDVDWDKDKKLDNTLFVIDEDTFKQMDVNSQDFSIEIISPVNGYPAAKIIYKK